MIRPGRRTGWIVAGAYAALLAASHLVETLNRPVAANPPAGVRVPAMASAGPMPGRFTTIASKAWDPDRAVEDSPAVVLLHGSPGAAGNFDALAPRLAAQGYRVLAPDLPGFGGSVDDVPSYSILAHARAVLAWMDALGVGRAHVVGWSMGGGVALHMADLEPGRVASVTLMASIGAQETEGSGSYFFEHVKYAVMYAGLVVGPELVPHFGVLDDGGLALALSRNFWDTDQRPLRPIMERLAVPAMVLHGRHDFLVADWAAERHHELMPGSRLVMADASHFLPFLQPDETALHLTMFFRDAERGGPLPEPAAIDLAPRVSVAGPAGDALDRAVRTAPWWLAIAAVAALALWRPMIAAALLGWFVGRTQLDAAVAITGLLTAATAQSGGVWLVGRVMGPRAAALPMVRRRAGGASAVDAARRLATRPMRTAFVTRFQPWHREEMALASGIAAWTGGANWSRLVIAALGAGVGAVAWSLLGVLGGSILAPRVGAALAGLATGAGAATGVAAGLVAAAAILRLFEHALTSAGRARVLARATRWVRFEYWPTWLVYIPVLAHMARLGRRHGGVMTISACNPAIPGGGGIIGESKSAIIDAMSHAGGLVAPTRLIPAGGTPEDRAARAMAMVRDDPALGGFPVILKPDRAFRGHALRLARTEADVAGYFRVMLADAIIQRYHPGPMECGLMWIRYPEGTPDDIRGGRAGFIYSVTRKEFPVLTGDGRRTIEQLVYRHRRFRCQAATFLRRFGDDRSRVLARGETLRLAISGNHCQGTLFRDGSDLITPELEAAIDRIAASFPHPRGMGLDVGRFDARYESDELLRRGAGFAIVELNGTAGESTNIYDPSKSMAWAYRVLMGQVTWMYRLGAERRRAGARVMTLRGLRAAARRYHRERSGPSLAD